MDNKNQNQTRNHRATAQLQCSHRGQHGNQNNYNESQYSKEFAISFDIPKLFGFIWLLKR
jgi:hypothetical protein